MADSDTDKDTDQNTDKDTDKDTDNAKEIKKTRTKAPKTQTKTQTKTLKDNQDRKRIVRLCVHVCVCLRVTACVFNNCIHVSVNLWKTYYILHVSRHNLGWHQSKRLLELDTRFARSSRLHVVFFQHFLIYPLIHYMWWIIMHQNTGD